MLISGIFSLIMIREQLINQYNMRDYKRKAVRKEQTIEKLVNNIIKALFIDLIMCDEGIRNSCNQNLVTV